ncbi:MAG TPA: DegT/DnrJ/EryC1/StrS family aminotransferase [Candidatus Omnitrophota bacterium]|nr:DegT/DnrJ/EryC1/StrS family aminotransferase [Candidatus Omnitrophota bacterium]
MIPVNAPFLGKQELCNVADCVKSGWISSKGKYIKQFEEEFARFCGTKYAISTTSGTTALHLAVSALGIGKGDEVIMPTFTMIATAYAVLYTGAKPVFIDSEPRTWNIDVTKIERAITRKTRAILPVHIYGHPADMDAIRKLARKYDLFVIEDAAQAHGAEYNSEKCGAMSDIGCFSFYANKIITTGEGGMVITDDKKLAERCRLLKDLAHSPKKRFLHTDLAYNYRMTNMQAAVGLAQLERIKEFIKIKRDMAELYSEKLSGIPGITLPVEEKWAKSVYWMYSIMIEKEFGMTRDELMSELLKNGVETRAFFVSMHAQPVMKGMKISGLAQKYPVAEEISEKGLYLPSGLSLKKKEIIAVCDTMKKLSSGGFKK